jgi:hypothetical protein
MNISRTIKIALRKIAEHHPALDNISPRTSKRASIARTHRILACLSRGRDKPQRTIPSLMSFTPPFSPSSQ